MKRNARLYLPWPVVSAFLASAVVPSIETQPYRSGKPLAQAERLKGGCLLYRLTAEPGRVMAKTTC
jgi:hypothetical protein